jgi:hypothetical protein
MELSEKTMKHANTMLDMLHKETMEETIEAAMKIAMRVLLAKEDGCTVIVRDPEGNEKPLSLK